MDRRWYRSVRKEPNKERKVGLIGCRRRNLAVSICHSVARGRVLDALVALVLPFVPWYLPFYLNFSSSHLRRRRASACSSSTRSCTLTRNLSLNSAVALVRLDVSRILREFWSLFEPPWNSIHVSRRSRQKSHDCRRIPSCRRAPSYDLPHPPFYASTIAIREIRSIRQSRVQ